MNFGTLLYGQGMPDEAIAEYLAAEQLNPFLTATVHLDIGNTLLQQGKLSEAEQEYRQAIGMNPTLAQAWNGLATVLSERGDMAGAGERIRIALRFDPRLVRARCNLGKILAREGKPAEAAAEFREALRIDPENLDSHYNLAVAGIKQGRPREAIAEFRRAMDTVADRAEGEFLAGQSLRPDRPAGRRRRRLPRGGPPRTQSAEGAAGSWPGCWSCWAMRPRLSSIIANCSSEVPTRGRCGTIWHGSWLRTRGPACRDGQEALRLIEPVCRTTNYKEPAPMQTLAAAYAEAGQFDRAVEIASRALDLARSQGNQGLAANLQRLLESYRQRKPWYGR